MASLGEVLQLTVHQSVLVRKAKALGYDSIEGLIALAVLRGCGHYRNAVRSGSVRDLGETMLSNEDLVILLLHNHYVYEPMAVRCAGQLLKKRGLNVESLAFLARKERCVEALHYISSLGLKHDQEGEGFWRALLKLINAPQLELPVGVLPHVSRFMINPGIQRGRVQPARWISPTE